MEEAARKTPRVVISPTEPTITEEFQTAIDDVVRDLSRCRSSTVVGPGYSRKPSESPASALDGIEQAPLPPTPPLRRPSNASNASVPSTLPAAIADGQQASLARRGEGQAQAKAAALAESLASSLTAAKRAQRSRQASNVIAQLAMSPLTAGSGSGSGSSGGGLTPTTAKYASQRSPCFFHTRFNDAIDVDRVLEEIYYQGDGLSTSRLVQTATGVREIGKQLMRHPIRRPVRSVMIVTKARDNSLVYLTRELAEWLLSTPRYEEEVGVNVYVDSRLRHSKRFDAPSLVSQNPRYHEMLRYWDADLCWSSPEKFDLVLTLGGDGTVLFTSLELFQRVVPPVLAFSLGSLGFLTNFEFASYKESLNRIMGDVGMRVNLRMRFTCTVFRADLNRRKQAGAKVSAVDTAEMEEAEQFEVLNELVIDRGPSPYVSNLELYGDNEFITVVQADGCIFSTPTGSTAYSLSAGGPLTHPSIPGVVLTPICPHTLSFRPMVLSDSLLLKVCVPRNSRSTAYATFDGKHRVELRRGDCIQIEAGRFPFPTVVGEHGTGGEWFESVRRALRWNTRGAVQKAFAGTVKPAAADKKPAPVNPSLDGLPGSHDEKPSIEANDHEDENEDEDEEEWDIDPDATDAYCAADSGIGASEASSYAASPRRNSTLTMTASPRVA